MDTRKYVSVGSSPSGQKVRRTSPCFVLYEGDGSHLHRNGVV